MKGIVFRKLYIFSLPVSYSYLLNDELVLIVLIDPLKSVRRFEERDKVSCLPAEILQWKMRSHYQRPRY